MANSKGPEDCTRCGGWINPPWKRGDGDYRQCECKVPKRGYDQNIHVLIQVESLPIGTDVTIIEGGHGAGCAKNFTGEVIFRPSWSEKQQVMYTKNLNFRGIFKEAVLFVKSGTIIFGLPKSCKVKVFNREIK